MTKELVEVVQADRDAAAKVLGYQCWADATDYRLTGEQDRQVAKFVEAFARHRIAAQQEGVDEEMTPRPNFAEFADAVLIAASMYTDVELAFWLTAPQPLIGMWTPVQLLARGEADKLLSVMRALENGAYV